MFAANGIVPFESLPFDIQTKCTASVAELQLPPPQAVKASVVETMPDQFRIRVRFLWGDEVRWRQAVTFMFDRWRDEISMSEPRF